MTAAIYIAWSFVETIGLRQFHYDQARWDGHRFIPTGKFVTVCDDDAWKCWLERQAIRLSAWESR